MAFSSSSTVTFAVLAAVAFLVIGAVRRIYFHPLSKFPGHWYASATSFTLTFNSILRREPYSLLGSARKYGRGNNPVRISPTLILFPKASSLKDIYCDPKHNTKARVYGVGLLGPPSIFSVLDGEEHRVLRRALGGPQWSFGALKKVWEPRIDTLIQLLISQISAAAGTNKTVNLTDKVAYLAADVMTLVTFGEPWGFLANDRDEHQLLENWRQGLTFFALGSRFRFFREYILNSPLGAYLMPSMSDKSGMGYLAGQADEQVGSREKMIEELGFEPERKDYIQYALEAKIKGEPLPPITKRAHIALLIQAGADTTATAMSSVLRHLVMNPPVITKLAQEIASAEASDLLPSLSTEPNNTIQYEQTRAHLPYMVACIKEGMRLNPPVSNLFARVAGPGGAVIDGVHVPEGTEMTSNAYVVHRDPELYAPDPESFRPERWTEGEEKRVAEMEAGNFSFGMGPRICLGKDIAVMELYKALPEIIRRFDMEVLDSGRYIVSGGIAWNEGLLVKPSARVPV